MGKYRICVEEMDTNREWEPALEVDGFAIITDCGDSYAVSASDMSVEDIAKAIVEEKILIQAAVLAKAYHDMMVIDDRDKAKTMASIFGKLSALSGDVDDDDC